MRREVASVNFLKILKDRIPLRRLRQFLFLLLPVDLFVTVNESLSLVLSPYQIIFLPLRLFFIISLHSIGEVDYCGPKDGSIRLGLVFFLVLDCLAKHELFLSLNHLLCKEALIPRCLKLRLALHGLLRSDKELTLSLLRSMKILIFLFNSSCMADTVAVVNTVFGSVKLSYKIVK
jgi:hypothetical protein